MICLANPDRFSWRHWDGELILYDDLSGVTRLAEGPVGAILEILAEIAPTDRAQLERHIETVLDVAMDANLRNMLEGSLKTLRDYGVIEDLGERPASAP